MKKQNTRSRTEPNYGKARNGNGIIMSPQPEADGLKAQFDFVIKAS